jgi:polysaccharide pyruvyl transferase WcaK-like protein
MFLPIKNIITLGVGWWQYQAAPTSHTIRYYKNLLSSSLLHSVRDSYTQSKMLEMGFSNVINTTCPTLWGLSGMNVNRKNTKKQDCVFTLTDYNPSEVLDTKLLEILLDNFSGKLYFFAQGSKDLEYINSLEFYKKNKGRFDMISTLVDYNYILKTEVVFVGTRLHAGARALQNGVDTLVVEVDNRTTEIRKDTNYPSIERDNFKTLQKWLDGETVFDNLQIDANSINTWKSQFINQKI